MQLKTYIVCSCGKKFVNKTEFGHVFAIGTHEIKQIFYNIAAQIHFLIYRHRKEKIYEKWESEK